MADGSGTETGRSDRNSGRGRVPLYNRVVAAILASPFHAALDRGLILISYRGRRTGRMFSTPVEFVDAGGSLVVLVADAAAKQWWRNVRADPAVRVLLRGVVRTGQATVAPAEDATLADELRRYVARKPRAGRAIAAGGCVVVRIDLDPPSP